MPSLKVNSLLEKLKLRILPDQRLSMQTRLYRLICVVIGLVCLVVILPINLFANLPYGVNLADALLGCVALQFYRQSCRGKDYPLLMFLVMQVLLNPVWFLNGGSCGSITFYFLTLPIYSMVLLGGKKRWGLPLLCVVNVCLLIILEHYFPSLVTPFQSPSDQVIDIISGAVCCCLMLYLIVWVVIANYNLEQALLSRYSKELALSLERLQVTQSTMDAASEQILWADALGNIIYSNRAITAALGYSTTQLALMTVHDLAPEFQALEWADHWSHLKQERSIVLEWSERCSNGTFIPVEVKMTYMNFNGKEYAVAFIRDITERKQAEERRFQIEHQMQHVQRLESVGVLAGGIAHDFNNMLTAMLINLSLVRKGTPSSSANHELLAEVEKVALNARSLTGQLLAFAKGGKPIKRAISVESIVRDSLSLALRGSSVKCDIRVAPNIGLVEADPGQLGQVFNNLILNARDAMPLGGTLLIALSRRAIGPGDDLRAATGPYVEILFEDNGSGIEPQNLDKIFDPFFSTKKAGSGLGLAVVFANITNHQGYISIESKVGLGTVFKILLPALALDVKIASNPNCGAPVAADPFRSRRILVMDDQEIIRKPLANILVSLGYQVQCVCDGDEAILAYRQACDSGQPFDLAIMDLTIPGGMGGKEAIRHLLEIDPDIKAVVSSGYSEDPVMSNYRAHGFVDVIVKPYAIETLEQVLQQVLHTPAS